MRDPYTTTTQVTPEALAAFNSGVTRARRDYTLHPTEFASPRYCCVCSMTAGAGDCARCVETRRQRVQRAERKAA